ncbi:MAG TPA: cellulase family glycosylhydrolase [Kofleriaceae bacterium]|nr:cellulase family glycosylhydrolase [Kofleriaceae bacterium]
MDADSINAACRHTSAADVAARTNHYAAVAFTLSCVAIAVGCGGNTAVPTPDASTSDAAATLDSGTPDAADPTCGGGRCAIRVVGGRFERDGRPWIPNGAVITGFVAPQPLLKGAYAKARMAWGQPLLTALRAMGANTIRFNVSMAAIDPTNFLGGAIDAAGKAAYLEEIKTAVALVEANGMNVIMTMQTGDVAGDPDAEPRPGEQTARAWRVLAPVFGDDPAVILNAFNEPGFGGAATIDEDQSPWQVWRTGFTLLVDSIRATGATNVIMLDGISTSRVWRKNTDANVPVDPLNQLAYDIHPFPTDPTQRSNDGNGAPKLSYTTTADIDYWLDGWCDTHACAATAFFSGISLNADAGNCYDGKPPGPAVTSPDIVRAFANHFQAKHIGIMLFAGDWAYRVFDDPAAPAALTTFVGFTDCLGNKRMGPASAMKALWTTGTVPLPVP